MKSGEFSRVLSISSGPRSPEFGANTGCCLSMNAASLEHRYRLRAGVRVRREAFGALLYDADSEALYVVRPPAAVALLSRLDGQADLSTVVKSIYGSEGASTQALAIVGQLLEWGALDEV